LNGHVRHNAIFTKPTVGSEFQSFDCTKKKRLYASNVAFLWDSRCEIKMTDILNIEDEPIIDDGKIETHTYNPFAIQRSDTATR